MTHNVVEIKVKLTFVLSSFHLLQGLLQQCFPNTSPETTIAARLSLNVLRHKNFNQHPHFFLFDHLPSCGFHPLLIPWIGFLLGEGECFTQVRGFKCPLQDYHVLVYSSKACVDTTYQFIALSARPY